MRIKEFAQYAENLHKILGDFCFPSLVHFFRIHVLKVNTVLRYFSQYPYL